MARPANLLKILWWAFLDWKESDSDQIDQDDEDWNLTKYSDDELHPENAWHPEIISIVVRDQRTADELAEALHYIHNGRIDTDYKTVNTLVHIYQRPEMIVVDTKALSAQLLNAENG